jgi:dolichyl-phosphate-mannose--protein O-mannosyl transferase
MTAISLRQQKIIGFALVLAFAALTRFINLGRPDELVFDEVYYVDGARDFLTSGVELDKGAAEFIVHPPIGKWAIALGIQVFGSRGFVINSANFFNHQKAVPLIFLEYYWSCFDGS